MSQLFERTAKTPFKLDGKPVAAGQVVTLTASQLVHLSAAGCVEHDATANRDVRRQDLPPLQGSAVTASDPRQLAYADASESVLALLIGRKLSLSPDAWHGLSIEERTRVLVSAREEIEAAYRDNPNGIATDTEEGRRADEAVRQHAGNDPAAASASQAPNAQQAVADDLGDLSAAKLRELAKAEGVDLGDANSKAELVAAIRAHRAQAA